jgi:hypothetical protein
MSQANPLEYELRRANEILKAASVLFVGRTAAAPGRRLLATASSAIANVSTTPHAPSRALRQDLRRPDIRQRGALHSVLLTRHKRDRCCFGGATTSFVAVSSRTAPG